MRLLGTLEKQTEISYDVVIFNQVANLLDSLGDATLNQLDYTEFAHAFTYDNVVNSWKQLFFDGINPPQQVDYVYQIINDGTMELDTNGNIPLNPRINYVLSLRLKRILQKIFQFAGFNVIFNGYLNTSEFANLYMDTTTKRNFGESIPVQEIRSRNTPSGPYSCGCDAPVSGYHLGTTPGTAIAVPTTIKTGDPNNDYNETTSIYTAPNDCTLSYVITLKIVNITNTMVDVFMNINGVTVGWQSHSSGNPGSGYPDPCLANKNTITFTGTHPMLAGDTAAFTFHASYATQNTPNHINQWNLCLGAGNDNSFVFVIQNQSVGSLMETQFSDVKMADVVKDVMTMFNVITEDKGNRTIEFTPYPNYISSNVLDWTNKVDINELKLETVEIPKELNFLHANDNNDYYLETYLLDNDINYGQQKVQFSTDSEEIENIQLKVFAAPFLRTIEGANTTHLHHSGKEEDDGIVSFKNKPRIVHLKGSYNNDDLTPTTFMEIIDTTNGLFQWVVPGTGHNEYPEIHHYNQKIASCTSSSNSFLFGAINPSAIVGLPNQPTRTLYNRFWKDYINEKYNNNARLLKCKIVLSATDILNLDFAAKYQIQDQFYRLNKVDYNTDKNKLSSVELIRI
jgi:hypothetical protein